MCNEVRRIVALGQIRETFDSIRIPLRFPEGLPNFGPAESVRITDSNPIVRVSADRSSAELMMRRWSWRGAGGRPVFNYRSEGREFRNSASQGRCLVVADGFYEFTASEDPAARRKAKWLFTMRGAPFFCIAGLWRGTDDPAVEAFTLLTTSAGPDVAPYHQRQICILKPADWAGWLDGSGPAAELLHPLAEGSLDVERVA